MGSHSEYVRQGSRAMPPEARTTFNVVLTAGKKSIPVEAAEGHATFTFDVTDDLAACPYPTRVFLTITFSVPGKALGLSAPLDAETINVQFTCVGRSNQKDVFSTLDDAPAKKELPNDSLDILTLPDSAF